MKLLLAGFENINKIHKFLVCPTMESTNYEAENKEITSYPASTERLMIEFYKQFTHNFSDLKENPTVL